MTSRKGDKAKGRHILIPIEVAGAHRDRLDAQADTLERLGAERADPAALDTVARVLSLPIGKSGPVQEGTRVQLGNFVVPDAGVWAFQGTKPGATSPVIEASVAYYVFRLDSVQAAGVPPLAQIRPSVRARARLEKKNAAGEADGRGVPEAAGVGRVGRGRGEGDEAGAPRVRAVHPDQSAAHRSDGGGHRVRARRGPAQRAARHAGRPLRDAGAGAHQGGLGRVRQGSSTVPRPR